MLGNYKGTSLFFSLRKVLFRITISMWLKGLKSIVNIGLENIFAPMLFTLLNVSGKSLLTY